MFELIRFNTVASLTRHLNNIVDQKLLSLELDYRQNTLVAINPSKYVRKR